MDMSYWNSLPKFHLRRIGMVELSTPTLKRGGKGGMKSKEKQRKKKQSKEKKRELRRVCV